MSFLYHCVIVLYRKFEIVWHRRAQTFPMIVTETQFLIGLCTTDVQYRAI
jgi:hypothetical protein